MNDVANSTPRMAGAFSGYHVRTDRQPDDEVTRVGPGTPCGEYLRRFWHPVAMTQDLGELPLTIRVLGEDLVLFRDLAGRYGLVHKNCPHRLASLEYGKCESDGLRCCYHGWLFDIDGTILDVPGQPAAIAERIKRNVRLGAYPVQEYKGLIFAYMGPPEETPEFPIYDAFVIPGMEMVPYKAPFGCNWLQVLDAILDPLHTSFLHARISRAQFSEELGELGELEFYDRTPYMLGTNTRRVGDNVWVRVNEMVFPNFTQAGALFACDGTAPRYFGRSAFVRWVVPIDDTNTVAYAWGCFGDRADPPEWNTQEGLQLIEQGELFDRTYDVRQRFPGDLEAVEGMGEITIHKNEHLVPSDRGIALMRRVLRQQIRDVKNGARAKQPVDAGPMPVNTYGSDTVLHLPPQPGRDDGEFLREVGNKVMTIYHEADHLRGDARDNQIFERLRALEAAGGQ
ncbi:MAG: aromatic ring-hydroxylating dioxygenase subunit alpha [Dongiaceae bacterium]